MNLKKIVNSKYTSLNPKNKEKHFTVIKLDGNTVTVEALISKQHYTFDVILLKDNSKWAQGWK